MSERRSELSTDKRSREKLKVTDKRLFTVEGDVRDEYRDEIRPAEQTEEPAPRATEPKQTEERPSESKSDTDDDPMRNPGTPFTMFIESLLVNAYMSLGMLRNPYQPEAAVDVNTARQMIDMISMLQEKTRGNLSPEEDAFLDAHLGDLKLAFVRKSKAL